MRQRHKEARRRPKLRLGNLGSSSTFPGCTGIAPPTPPARPIGTGERCQGPAVPHPEAAQTRSSQTSVEIRIGQAGQSHTGHDTAVTATGFPQPGPGPFSRTPLPSLAVLTCCYRLYRFAAFAYKRSDLHKVSYSHGTRTILSYRHNYAVQKKKYAKCMQMPRYAHCVWSPKYSSSVLERV